MHNSTPAALFLRHLRLPFQFILAPIFFVGALSTGRSPDFSWIVPFLLVHLGLYGGATAFNSFYDQDRGPIGFWKRPRPATPAVRTLALLLQALSVLLLALFSYPAAGIALVMMLMGVAYSHPRTRWKASTWGGLLAVALGQGLGAVLLGYFVARGGAAPEPSVWLAGTGAALLTAGLYPTTQVYQVEEDRVRGDMTFPARYGWRAALRFSWGASTLGLWLLGVGLRGALSRSGLLLLALCPVLLGIVYWLWGRRFEHQDEFHNHDWAMAIGAGASLLFWMLLAAGFAQSAIASEVEPAEPASLVSRGVARETGGARVRVWKDGPLTRIDATSLAPGSAEEAWAVILDYEGLPRFLSMLESSEILEREGSTVLVRQVGRARLVITKRFRVDLEFRRLDPRRVHFRQVKGDFKEFSGVWSVAPHANGVLIGFTAAVHHSLPLPGFLIRRALRSEAETMLPEVTAEIARRAREETSR